MAIGATHWAIAEGYIPPGSNGPSPEFLSHEAFCMLNTNATDAHVEVIVYFSDRDPIGPFVYTVPARRTLHARFNDMHNPESIPLGTDYASTITSDIPIVVQHTRLDSRKAENTIMTTIAYAAHS